jgi:hypothetical protein
MKMDNGSNSLKSQTIRIKVMKIKAVKLLSNPNVEKDNVRYSKQAYYWYNNVTGVVYDYDMHYAIGKIGYDDDNLPMKKDKDVYIITQVVPIPQIKEEEE